MTTIFAADGSNLGQKSSIDLAEAAKDANSGISKVTDFKGLPTMFKAASGDTYVRVESHDTAAMPGGVSVHLHGCLRQGAWGRND